MSSVLRNQQAHPLRSEQKNDEDDDEKCQKRGFRSVTSRLFPRAVKARSRERARDRAEHRKS